MNGKFDILIRGGLVYDGGTGEPRIADIGVAEGIIGAIGRCGERSAETVIDATGLAVCPGFIDTHSHSDFTIIADPRAEGKISQGITTEINGNCGMSAAPLYQKAYERREEDLRELGITERWNTVAEYLKILGRKGPAVNMAFLAGHGNVRGSVIGYEDKEPSPEELREMSGLLGSALEQGAIGFSTGLIYPPGVYSTTEELIYLSRGLRDRDLIYTSHMRSEGSRLIEAVREVIRIGRESGVKVHISHIKTAGEQNWGKAEEVISLLSEALETGVRISCDRYPYTASSTDLDAILPSWTYAGGNEEELRRLTDSAEKKRIIDEIQEQSSRSGYWEKVIISSVGLEKNRWMEGRTIAEISMKTGSGEIETVFRILLEERLRVGAIFLSMCEENLRKFLSLPYCMIGSDSSARSFDGPTRQGKPHPRGFGTFPRLLGKMVREQGIFSLTEAIHKSTLLAAKTFGLRGRGFLREGMAADITVFDPRKINDAATFNDPFQRSCGIGYVLVGGVVSLWEGALTLRRAGKVLKGQFS